MKPINTFKCSKTWDELSTTECTSGKHCSQCNQNVYPVENLEGAYTLAENLNTNHFCAFISRYLLANIPASLSVSLILLSACSNPKTLDAQNATSHLPDPDVKAIPDTITAIIKGKVSADDNFHTLNQTTVSILNSKGDTLASNYCNNKGEFQLKISGINPDTLVTFVCEAYDFKTFTQTNIKLHSLVNKLNTIKLHFEGDEMIVGEIYIPPKDTTKEE